MLGYIRCIFQVPYLLHVAGRRLERASVAHVRLLGVGTDGRSCTGVWGAVDLQAAGLCLLHSAQVVPHGEA